MELFGLLEDATLPIYLIRVTRFIEYLILMSNEVTQPILKIQARCCLVSPRPGPSRRSQGLHVPARTCQVSGWMSLRSGTGKVTTREFYGEAGEQTAGPRVSLKTNVLSINNLWTKTVTRMNSKMNI